MSEKKDSVEHVSSVSIAVDDQRIYDFLMGDRRCFILLIFTKSAFRQSQVFILQSVMDAIGLRMPI